MLLLVEWIYHLPFFKRLILSIVTVKSLSWAFFFFFSFPLLPSFLPLLLPPVFFFFLPSFSFFKYCDCRASHPHSYHWKIPECTSHSRNIKLEPFSHNLVGRAQTCEMSLTLRLDFGSRAGDTRGESFLLVHQDLFLVQPHQQQPAVCRSSREQGCVPRVFSVWPWSLPWSQDWFCRRAYDEPGYLTTLQAAVTSY